MRVAVNSTDVTTYFALSSTADGSPITNATITNIDLQYVRSGEAPTAKVDATALVATDSAHADNKAIEVDATDQPGLYRVDWPDAAFAAGVREVVLTVKYTGAYTEHLRVELSESTTGEVTWVHNVTVDAVPAEGALVRYCSDTSYLVEVQSGTTDALGNVTFHLPAGTYYVTVDAPGQARAYDIEVVS